MAGGCLRWLEGRIPLLQPGVVRLQARGQGLIPAPPCRVVTEPWRLRGVNRHVGCSGVLTAHSPSGPGLLLFPWRVWVRASGPCHG